MLQHRIPGNRESGFTLVELLVSMVISLMLLAAAYGVLVTQVRSFEIQRGTMDARETLRGAATLLTSEFRHASSSRGDLYAIAPQTVTLRSLLGSGVICDTLGTRYGVWQPQGDFQATAADSALIYSLTSETWNSVKVSQMWSDPVAGGIPTCAWAGGTAPALVVQVVPGDTAGVRTGSGIRAFRSIQYGLYQDAMDGRWWLGRKLASAGSYDKLTGPLSSPADSGLVFHYYDIAGLETADPTQVVRVELVLKAESYAQVRVGSGTTLRKDSVAVSAFIRN